MTGQRLRTWPERLDALVRERLSTPFAWGTHDCCLWAADAVQAVTGTDLAAAWRGRYADARGAYRLLHRHGGLRGLAFALLGAPIAPALAGPGDIGLVQMGEHESLAVHGGAQWLAAGMAGLQPVRPECIATAWRCDAWRCR